MKQHSAPVAQLSKKMKKLDVMKSAQHDTANHFPVRPAFGTGGRPVVLWTNYFQIKVKSVTLYKYTMDVVQVAQEPEGRSKRTETGHNREIKGRKLFFAVREALGQLSTTAQPLVLASEFKRQLLTRERLEFESNPVRIRLPWENNPERFDVIDVSFHGPVEMPVDRLLQYLRFRDGTEDASYPRFPETVDALNVILGHFARSQLDAVTTVGSARFFPFVKGEKVEALFDDYHSLVAARGAFQSARLGTGRLLLNANVTHAVFKVSGRLSEVMDKLGIRVIPQSDANA